MSKDTIGNLLTYIRNAGMNKKRTFRIPYTNISENIVKILLREGLNEKVKENREFLLLRLLH
uniref:Ribosomal protein S8 n=1 Tax=Pilea sp. RC1554 TaxID=1399729 RepID=U5YJB7_9ROSA|nr:ribosomal protein S8 [Pilea sp. RC1554]